MTLDELLGLYNFHKFTFSRTFTLLHIFGWTDVRCWGCDSSEECKCI